MSETEKVGIGGNVSSLTVQPKFDAYSGVEIVADENTTFFAGNRSGRILTIENEWGSQEQANRILASLQAKGFQFQPFTATGALLNPAAEIGDGISVGGIYSGLYKISQSYSPLMAADIEAPQDEEIDHEYPYEPKKDRIYRREIAEAKANIKLNADSISAEVFRATTAEESLQSAITQTANEISANVVKKTGGSSSSFGWSLTDSAWSVSSNGSEVFRIDRSGATVKGVITATSGTIGGFTIGNNAIYNVMNNLNSTEWGVYVGTDGISIGGGKFKVTNSGVVSAQNMILTGTLTIGGTAITAAALRSGAQSAYNNSGTWSTGASRAAGYYNATLYGTGSYPRYFYCGTLNSKNSQIVMGSYVFTPHWSNTLGCFILSTYGEG